MRPPVRVYLHCCGLVRERHADGVLRLAPFRRRGRLHARQRDARRDCEGARVQLARVKHAQPSLGVRPRMSAARDPSWGVQNRRALLRSCAPPAGPCTNRQAVRLRVADHAVRVNGQQFPLLLRPAIPAVKLRPPALGAREDWYLVEWRGLRQGRWASHSVIASCVFLRLIAASSAGKLARWPRVGSVPARPGR